MKSKKRTFEESMSRIEEIIGVLEANSATLEESIDYYEEAMKLVKECNSMITKIEGRVKKVIDSQTLQVEDFSEIDDN